MVSARSRMQGSAAPGHEVSQLLLVVSDGRGIFLEGMEASLSHLCEHETLQYHIQSGFTVLLEYAQSLVMPTLHLVIRGK